MEDVKAELDRMMRDLFGAFGNTGGAGPNLDVVREVFLPEGLIVKNVGGDTVTYDIESFIAPRQAMLTDGTLTEFSEWEIAERTEIFGSIAQRFSEYGKSGFRDGVWFEGAGRQTTQFVRTSAGWKMSAAAWDDA